MARVKVTGYLIVDDSELDPDDASGLTSEAYDRYAVEGSPSYEPVPIAELDDLDFSVE